MAISALTARDLIQPYVAPVLFGTAAVLLLLVVQKIRHEFALRSLAREHGCQPVRRWPLKDPVLGLDYWWAFKKAGDSKRLLNWTREQYDKYGTTYLTRMHTTNIVATCDPENLQALHVTRFNDFHVDHRREAAFLPLLGAHSVLLSNGEPWAAKRTMLKPSFTKVQFSNTALFDRHVENLIHTIKERGCKGNLDTLFMSLAVDMTSEIMYGKAIGVLTDKERGKLVADMSVGAEAGHAAWLLNFVAKFVRDPIYNASVKRVRDFIYDHIVKDALKFREALQTGSIPKQDSKIPSRAIYLEALARSTDNHDVMLDDLLTILIAGRDTTGSLLTNLFHFFSRKPDVWARVRAEVAVLDGAKPTHDQLKNMIYLQGCMREVLRLHSVIPINTRQAIRDTWLPRGGGKDGQSPIVIPKGYNVAFHVTALHRRKELWGEDADEFRPERWDGLQPGWAFQPFGMGPRNCPGQHLSLAEAGYTTVRIAQHFKEVLPLEDAPWEELIALTTVNAKGAQVELVPV